MNPNLENKLKEELDELKTNNLLRTVDDLRFISSTKAIDNDGNEFLVFGTNNYLGLTHHPDVIKAAQEASIYGTGSTGSRLTTGASFEARELESNISEFKNVESTLIFNTGYMTNLGVIYALTKENDIIFSDQLNHASIIDGTRISKAKVRVYEHKDTNDLEKKIKEELKVNDNENKSNFFIISDGVFSMDGDIAPLPELVEIADKYNCTLIIDEAHATGVIGKNGKGTVEYFKDKTGIDLTDSVDLQIGTLSKALASEGGFVCGKQVYIDYLINKSRPFIFSTALSPATIASANAALNLLKENSEEYLNELNSNTSLMRELLTNAGLNIVDGETPIIPIIIGPADLANKISKELEKEGILVSSIRPPSVPKDMSRLRLTVIATHTKEEIEYTAKKIIEIWNILNKN